MAAGELDDRQRGGYEEKQRRQRKKIEKILVSTSGGRMTTDLLQ